MIAGWVTLGLIGTNLALNMFLMLRTSFKSLKIKCEHCFKKLKLLSLVHSLAHLFGLTVLFSRPYVKAYLMALRKSSGA